MSDTPAEPEPKNNPLVLTIIVTLVGAALITAGYCFFKYFKRVRGQARETTLVGEARQIGSSAQQYFLTTGQTAVTFGYNPTTGALSGDITPWLVCTGRGYTFDHLPIESGASQAFTMQHAGAFNNEPVWFTDEGKVAFEWDFDHPNTGPYTPLKKK